MRWCCVRMPADEMSGEIVQRQSADTLANSEPSKDKIECTHNGDDWMNCQHCGRPHCIQCSGETNVHLPKLGFALPISLCSHCTVTLNQLCALIPDGTSGTPSYRCSAHANTAAAQPCKACKTINDHYRQMYTDIALGVLESLPLHGIGDQKTNAGRAAAATAMAVPGAILSVGIGAVTGLVGGAFSGLLAGGLLGSAAGIDSTLSKKGDKGKGKSSAPGAPAAVPAPAPSPAAAASAAGAGAADGDAAPAAAVGDGAAAPAPAASASSAANTAMMAKAKLILKMSNEEQEADAEAELKRIAGCKSAYEVLGVRWQRVGMDSCRRLAACLE